MSRTPRSQADCSLARGEPSALAPRRASRTVSHTLHAGVDNRPQHAAPQNMLRAHGRALAFAQAACRVAPMTRMSAAPRACATSAPQSQPSSLVSFGLGVLTAADPCEKVRLTNAAAAAWQQGHGEIGDSLGPSVLPKYPARPQLPRIVSANEMPSQRKAHASGISRPAYILHGMAHVELNAIDLAWDTAIRFGEGMDSEWFSDFLSIAVDEARHFTWLSKRLIDLGYSYGSMPAHRIIWDAADMSKTNRRDRLAIGQLVQEARGLDAGPKLAAKLVGYGDKPSSEIVATIGEEEVAHVQIGVKWFLRDCQQSGQGQDAVSIFHDIALRLSNPGAFHPPFNEERRRQAGLLPDWYLPVAEALADAAKSRKQADGGVTAT